MKHHEREENQRNGMYTRPGDYESRYSQRRYEDYSMNEDYQDRAHQGRRGAFSDYNNADDSWPYSDRNFERELSVRRARDIDDYNYEPPSERRQGYIYMSDRDRMYNEGEESYQLGLKPYAGYRRPRWSKHGPHRGVGPKGYKISDERLHEKVCDRLQECGEVDASEIEVSCSKGIVTLQGKVENRDMKRVAEDCVEDIYGVDDIMNQLTVEKGLLQKAREWFTSDD